jgi:electron transport complex protein RnfC
MAQVWRFHGGVHPEQHKTISTRDPVANAGLPQRLTLPLNQHIGQFAEPVTRRHRAPSSKSNPNRSPILRA